MINCCDFCDTQAESDAHLARMRAEYSLDAHGAPIAPPDGWQVLSFDSLIPRVHREWVDGQWARPLNGYSTMTPIRARCSGNVMAYAVRVAA